MALGHDVRLTVGLLSLKNGKVSFSTVVAVVINDSTTGVSRVYDNALNCVSHHITTDIRHSSVSAGHSGVTSWSFQPFLPVAVTVVTNFC